MYKVLIAVRLQVQYRVDFYNKLKESLAENNIELHLIHGKSNKGKNSKYHEKDINWAEIRQNRTLRIANKEITWQPITQKLSYYDLVIVEYANRNLVNYYLMILRKVSNLKLGFWGHAKNPFLRKKDFRNLIKETYLKQCDWWFAYTETEKKKINNSGYPNEKITAVQNAIDTKSLQSFYSKIEPDELSTLKETLNLTSDNIAIYCGAIYKEKRLDFLIEASDIIRNEISDFHLLILGSGPDSSIVTNACKSRDWIHYVGPKFGEDRVPYFKLSKLFLMPGALGLAILDSFAMTTPMVVSEFDHHGPELEYLLSGTNGIISKNNPKSFAHETVSLLKNNQKLASLKSNCQLSANKYTVEAMVENFKEGVQKCLAYK